MATAIKETTVSNLESAADRVRDLNERVIESSSKAGTASLEAYGRLLERVAEFQGAGRRKRLSKVDLGKVDAYERKHKSRATVPKKIDSLRS